MHKFVILTEQRSGSHMLMFLFNAHPNVGYPRNPEPFAHKEVKYPRDCGVAEIFEKNFTYQDEKYTHTYPDCITVAGVIVHGHQKDFRGEFAWKHLPRIKDLRIIFLERKNLLKRYLSKQILAKYGNRLYQPYQNLPKIKVDANKLVRNFEIISQRREEMKSYLKDTSSMNVIYKEMVDNYDNVMEKVQKFLGVPIKKLIPSTVKANRRSLQESIKNYDKLRKKLKNTEWATFFDHSL